MSETEPLNINGLIRDSRKIMNLLGVTEAADVLPELQRRLNAQQPVQARTTSGDLIWQHIPCGWPHPWHPDAEPDTGPDGDPLGCHQPGPWRPLLVGGARAPEVDDNRVPCEHCGKLRAATNQGPFCVACRLKFGQQPQPDLIAQVMEALGVDRPEDVLSAIETIRRVRDQNMACAKDYRQQRDEARAQLARYVDEGGQPLPTDAELDFRIGEVTCERNEARAEVERLKAMLVEIGHPVTDEPAQGPTLREELTQARAEVEQQASRFLATVNTLTTQLHDNHIEAERLKAQIRSEIEQADAHAKWADRLAWAALQHTGTRETEEASGNNELWQLALDVLNRKAGTP